MINKILLTTGLLLLIIVVISGGCSPDWPTDPPDVVRPEVTTSNPLPGSFLASASVQPEVTFSEEMDLATISANAFVVSGEGDTLPGTWSGSGTNYKFSPQSPLQELMSYSVIINGSFDADGKWLGASARDKNKNSLTNSYTFNFATVSPVSNTALYFGRSSETEFDQSGLQKGIGYVKLGDDAHEGNLEVSTIGDFAAGELRLFFNPQKDKIFVTHTTGNKVWILDPASNSLTGSFETGEIGPSFIAFTPSGNELWVLGKETGKIAVINSAGALITEIDAGVTPINSMVINHSGTRGYITTGSSNTGTVLVVDIQNRAILTEIDNILENGQDYAFINDIFVSSDDSKVYCFTNYASPHVQIINAASNSIESSITFAAGGSDDEWIPVIQENTIFAMARWGSGGFKIDLLSNTVTAQHALEEAGCYLGAAVDPGNSVIFAAGNPTWDSPSAGIFSIIRSSDLKKIITINTVNGEGLDLPWRYMLAK